MAGAIDLAAVWAAATDELADEIISAQQRAYLRLTRLRAIVEDTALLSVPDAFTRDVIESRLRPAITEALTRRLGRADPGRGHRARRRGRRRPAARHRLPAAARSGRPRPTCGRLRRPARRHPRRPGRPRSVRAG